MHTTSQNIFTSILSRGNKASKMASPPDSDWETVSDNSHSEDACQSSSDKSPVPSGASTSDITPLKYVRLLDEKIEKNFNKIKEAWPSIKNEIFNILETSSATAGYMMGISLFKLGTSIQRHSNPITVYVSVSAGSPEEGWPPVVGKMQAYLDTLGCDLHVHLEHNEMCHELFELLPVIQDTSSSSTEDMEENEKLEVDPYFEESEPDYSDGGHFRLLLETKLERHEKFRRDQDFAPDVREEYNIKVCPGADIGAAKYISREDGRRVNPLTGSLACWLDITLHNGKTKTVGLTAYHILRPAIRGYRLDSEEREYRPPGPGWSSGSLVTRSATTLADPDKDGGDFDLSEIDHIAYVEPRDRYKRYPPAKIEHPTRAKHNVIVENSNAIIANPICTPYWKRKIEERLREHPAFFDDRENILGSVIFTSGIFKRTDTNGRLDVGLIPPDDPARIGPNKFPMWESFNKKYDVEILPHSVPDLMMRDSNFIPEADGPGKIYTPLPNLPRLSYVYKCGPSFAGSSIGQTSAFPSDIAFTEDDHSRRGWIEPGTSIRSRRSTEFVVASNSTFYDVDSHDKYPFAYAGDNGTLIWDRDGRILGMLIASQFPKGAETGIYVVTPIEAVFEGIKKVSQGRILDVKLRTETAPAQDQGRYSKGSDWDW